jgi:hypothetical protein
MNKRSGFSTLTTLLIALGVAVLATAGYVAVRKPEPVTAPSAQVAAPEVAADSAPTDSMNPNSYITWAKADAGERDGVPQTALSVSISGRSYEVGTFPGSCSEVGTGGGIDGTGLLAGELSAVQCWFAGGGTEAGVFAHEDGGFQILVGELSEGEEGSGMFRGNFTLKADIAP